MNYDQIVKEILINIGGSPNVKNVWHCATRLRLNLVDDSKVNTEKVENINGVVTVVQSAGQYQVVIGNSVAKVYEALISAHPELNKSMNVQMEETNLENTSFINRLLAFVSSIFTPFLGPLAASGILKGLLVLTTTFNILSENDGAYQIWNSCADAIFYFLPLFIAFTAAKQLKVNQFVSVTIAASLVHPNLVALMAETGSKIDFFGLPVQAATYSASVIPILLSIWVLSYLEPLLDKAFPESVKNIFVPLLSIVIMVPLTLLAVGPLGNLVSSTLAIILASLYNFSPTLAGFVLGGIHQVIVIFGVHWALITLMINNISEYGQDPWLPIICIAVFAQAGSALGVFLKTKDKKMKSLSGSAFITAIFSITEPAIYGVNLKLKKPMYFALISGAIGGAFAGYGRVYASTFTFPGILAIPTYLGPNFIYEVIGLIISILLSATLSYFFGGINSEKNMIKEDSAEITPLKDFETSAGEGTVIDLNKVNDHVFSSGAMGKGFAIYPETDNVHSPVNGIVTTIFKTKHAIGITTHDGLEVLIHIGLDTVQLNGQHFNVLIEEGQKVYSGQKIVQFDREQLIELGYDPTIIIVITNTTEFPTLNVDIHNQILVNY